jgi:pyruvyl transferase EpsO
MNLLIALALALAPRRAHADGPPAKGLRAFEGEPGDKKFVDASSSRTAYPTEATARQDAIHAECLSDIQAQTVDIFRPLLRPDATLVDPAYHGNVGDNLLNIGELRLSEKLEATLGECGETQSGGRNPACSNYIFPLHSTLMWHAGGNFGDIWRRIQDARLRSLERVAGKHLDVNVVSMPQSLAYIKGKRFEAQDASRIQRVVSDGLDLTLTWRQQDSFDKARKLFPGATNVLAPDMAFMIGHVQDTRAYTRVQAPELDILFLMRADQESVVGGLRSVRALLHRQLGPAAATCAASSSGCGDDRIRWSAYDWGEIFKFYNKSHGQPPPIAPVFSRHFDYNTRIEAAVAMFSTAKVVVSDRMHGGILAFLMKKPHVVIDQITRKATRTREVAFRASAACRRADVLLYEYAAGVAEAVDKAKALLAILCRTEGRCA